MKISEAFLVNTRNFDAIIEALVNFDDDDPVIDSSLLEMLGYTDPNDLLVVRLLKDLNIINQDGEAGKYFNEFQNPETTKKALAKGVLDAYAPLFQKDEQIYKAEVDDLKKAFDDVFDGKKTNLIIKYISGTFHKITTYCGAETIEAVMANRELDVTQQEPAQEMAVASHQTNGSYHDNAGGLPEQPDMGQQMDGDSQQNLKDTPMPEYDDQHPQSINNESDQSDDTDHGVPEETIDHAHTTPEAFDDTEEDLPETNKDSSVDTDPIDLSVSMSEVTDPELSSDSIPSTSAADQQSFVEKALIRKSELLHKLQRWEELIPALDNVIDRFDNAEHSYLEDVVTRSIVRRAFVLVKLHRNDDALPALDQVINRFKDANDTTLHKHASVAMLHKAELLEEDDTADLLPLYDAIIDRLDGHSNDHLNEKVDYIFNKRFDLILNEGSQEDILSASQEVIDRFKNQSNFRDQLQKAMIKKAEILDETDRSEEALEAYDEFLAKFG